MNKTVPVLKELIVSVECGVGRGVLRKYRKLLIGGH